MTIPYTKTASGATARPKPSHRSTKHRTRFACAARNKAFRRRDLSLAREPGFVDRQPDHLPPLLGEVVARKAEAAGRTSISYWLDQASQAETEAERSEALAMAERIAKQMRMPLATFLFGRLA